jgi:geranylgeranyl diphosphate synthase type I
MTETLTDPAALARATHDLLRAALLRLDPQLRHVCGYHLGYWDADGSPTSLHGKGIRPELVILS